VAAKLYADRHQSRLFGSSPSAVRIRDLARYAAVGLLNLGDAISGRNHDVLPPTATVFAHLLQNPRIATCVFGG